MHRHSHHSFKFLWWLFKNDIFYTVTHMHLILSLNRNDKTLPRMMISSFDVYTNRKEWIVPLILNMSWVDWNIHTLNLFIVTVVIKILQSLRSWMWASLVRLPWSSLPVKDKEVFQFHIVRCQSLCLYFLVSETLQFQIEQHLTCLFPIT